tara:strand:- start:321 stop:575 length:255 start_codon:yes stop_codon:yes gene_type:complete
MKISIQKLREIVQEEQEKLAKTPKEVAEDAPEVDADEMGTALEQQLDFMKALKIKEARARRRANRLLAQRRGLARKIQELKSKK